MAEGYENRPMYRYLLWANPHAGSWDPNTHGDIILSSDDYDYLEFEIRLDGGNPALQVRKVRNYTGSFVVCGENVSQGAIADNFLVGRIYYYQSRTRFRISDGTMVRWGASSVATANHYAVPNYIYGIKYS